MPSFRGLDAPPKLVHQHGIDPKHFSNLPGDALTRDCSSGLNQEQGARGDARLPRKLPDA